MISGKQRRFLKSKAQTMRSTLQVGKNGLNDQVLEQIRQLLNLKELVKLNILQNSAVETSDIRDAVTDYDHRIQFVQAIGRTVILYKRAPKIENRKISLDVDKI